MADVIWPAILLPTGGGNPVPSFANVAGPASTDGQAQVVATDAGFWKISMGQVPIYTPKLWRAWNATALQLNGRARSCLIPIYSRAWAPWPQHYGRKIKPPKKGPNANGALIWVTLEGVLAMGGVSATLRLKQGSPLEAGIHFSTGERLFAIQKVNSWTRDGNDRLYSVVLWPPAREAVAAGTRLEFDRPVFRARLASDTEMDVAPDVAAMGSADVGWTEDT
jgi:hypothetical protein